MGASAEAVVAQSGLYVNFCPSAQGGDWPQFLWLLTSKRIVQILHKETAILGCCRAAAFLTHYAGVVWASMAVALLFYE